MAGHAKDPDFLLHGRGGLGRRSLEACRRLIDSDIAGVIEGLVRATRRYEAGILTLHCARPLGAFDDFPLGRLRQVVRWPHHEVVY